MDTENRKAWDVEKVFIERADALRGLAELGVSNAQFALGLMYEIGEGVEQDIDQAVKWYGKAAEQGLVSRTTPASGVAGIGEHAGTPHRLTPCGYI